jgi:hypothetical protein
MRKLRIALATLVAGTGIAAVATVATTESAQAAPMKTSNCISPTEKSHLRLGLTTKQVNAQTHAHPWFHMNDSYEGTRYAMYAYDDCRVNSGKMVVIAFRVAYDGSQHLALARYAAL